MTVAAGLLWPGVMSAQEMPGEYKTVLTTLGKSGDFKEGVLKVNIPRNDLRVTINQRPAPTPFGFGGWIALTKGDGGHDVMMGDLVLTEDEVNPVMSAPDRRQDSRRASALRLICWGRRQPVVSERRQGLGIAAFGTGTLAAHLKRQAIRSEGNEPTLG